MPQKNFKWTAIFLIRGAADNILELTQMLNQLAAVEKTKEIAVVLCINLKAESAPAILPLATTVGSGNVPIREPGWTTLFCSLESKPEGGCVFKAIREKRSFRMDREEDVSGFFKHEILSSFASEQYILFTWDHGQPFGIFPGKNEDLVKASKKGTEKIDPAVVHFRLKKQLEKEKRSTTKCANLSPDDALPILSITELKQAIQWAFEDEKIDIVVMSNCFLQFFDTGYELSACANYLVAFETEMFFKDAFDYKMILEIIAHDPEIKSDVLAKAIVFSFSLQKNGKNRASQNSVALFANDLSWYPSLAKLIDELSVSLIRELPRNRQKITAAINKCEYISPNIPAFCLTDFRNFIRCLYAEVPSVFSSARYELFEMVLDKLVISSYVGNDFLAEDDLRFVSPSCFSVYLPREIGDYKTFFLDNFMQETSLSPTAFVKRFRWESFINSFVLS